MKTKLFYEIEDFYFEYMQYCIEFLEFKNFIEVTYI